MVDLAHFTRNGKPLKTPTSEVYDEETKKYLPTILSEFKHEMQSLRQAVQGNTKSFVAPDIAARDALTGMNVGDQCWVLDASADNTVAAGAAGYVWQGASSGWVKTTESESMDDALHVTTLPTSMPEGLRDGGRLTVDIEKI
ncbi:MAG: hypothetical protein E7022_03240 [Desulfovibrio desulfuricans]|nr:hypothetical protein [Desulfovibrio desulfuricans]